MAFLLFILTARLFILYIMHVNFGDTKRMNSTILTELLPPTEGLSELDLDALRQKLETARAAWADLEGRTRLYESEFQREVRAKIDLCGGIPACPTPEAAFALTGQPLLTTRREIRHKFNQIFFMAPLSRHAQTPSSSVPRPTPAPTSADRARGPSYPTGARG
jgi:hypothetical protein